MGFGEHESNYTAGALQTAPSLGSDQGNRYPVASLHADQQRPRFASVVARVQALHMPAATPRATAVGEAAAVTVQLSVPDFPWSAGQETMSRKPELQGLGRTDDCGAGTLACHIHARGLGSAVWADLVGRP